MKILFIHNDYIKHSGEEAASGELARLLEEHGHEIKWFRKSSATIHGLYGKVQAFFLGIYNPKAAKELSIVIEDFKPDIVQVQNIYPFISTSIFKVLREKNLPVVMRCPNYRLFCPNGFCLDNKGAVCEKCFGKGKEFWCAYKNCEKSRIKSIGYALRGCFARVSRNIIEGVGVFIVQSDFQKNKFVAMGIPESKISILPGIAPEISIKDSNRLGDWVSFVGRISSEKGINEFIESARNNPDIPFKVAGNFDVAYKVPKGLPENMEFVGFLKGDSLNKFYMNSRIIVVPSKWYEGFPNVIVRGMLLKRPIITTNIGAMQNIIKNEVNGILVPPADSTELSHAIKDLYHHTDKCTELGLEGYKDAINNYSRETIYVKLLSIYDSLI